MSARNLTTAAGLAAAIRSNIRKGQEPSVPYARKWEIGGCAPIHSLRTYPCDGIEVLSEGLAKLGRRIVPTEYGLLVGDSGTGLWVAANRSIRGEGPPDAYIVGRYGEKESGYTVNAAEVVLTLLEQILTPVPQLPADSELQVGFPGLLDRGVTYVGSWQWNVHGEARGDEFARRAAHATLVTIRSEEPLVRSSFPLGGSRRDAGGEPGAETDARDES